MTLGDHNLVRQDSTSIEVKGMKLKVEYRLHKDESPNPEDPSGNPIETYFLHFPQINTAYVNHSEEKVFEDFFEFFEKDFIVFYAQKLIEERTKNNKNDKKT